MPEENKEKVEEQETETAPKKDKIPDGVWLKCKNCQETLFAGELDKNSKVCPKCDYHYPLSAKERIAILTDKGTFEEMDADVAPIDILGFVDRKPYTDRLEQMEKKTGTKDAFVDGLAETDGIPISIGAMEFGFIGGSMGSVVGEKVTRTLLRGVEKNVPVVIATATGGARMMEGIISLMQMSKTNAARAELAEARLPYIVVISDPTTAGVMASYAAVGDALVGEPNALMGFAGPRVIKETIMQDLPEGFQRSEFQLEHGFLDIVVHRHEIKATVANLLRIWLGGDKDKFG
ncbi:MAG: acetyl-CoA carboxylase carboxyltransferase subunit beta [bacterium]|nr:acetyl-CoA carboxylase carboxyltransferase subunit beta [bacterium]